MHSLSRSVAALLIAAIASPATAQEAGCTFTITSSGGISCPAGELSDGQIRLNGSESTASFTISNGQITDSAGRGCIVTDPPTTQVQCDLNAAPASGFSIGGGGVISYQGNSTFYACPATDTEYNIYINPNFGQTKCFPVTLTASGCGQNTCPPQSVVTEWQTSTVSVTVFTTVMSPTTVTASCSPITSSSGGAQPWSNSTTSIASGSPICHKCSKSLTLQTSTTTASIQPGGPICHKCTPSGDQGPAPSSDSGSAASVASGV